MTHPGATQNTGALVEHALDERLDAFLRSRADCADDPSTEAVHQIRVATRRLRAALNLFDPLLTLPDDVAPRILRRVERRFGRVRDLDVVRTALREAGAASGSHSRPAAYSRLAATVDASGREARKRAVAEIGRRRLRHATGGLRSWLEHPVLTPVAQLPVSLIAPDLLLPFLARALLHPGWQIAEPPDPDAAAATPLHALRRRLKQLRYAVECLTDWYGAPGELWLSELHAIQDGLGDWHDQGLLLELIAGADGTAALRLASLERARTALAAWPAWRARYLDSAVRTGLRTLLGGASPNALGTASTGSPRAGVRTTRRRRSAASNASEPPRAG